MTRAEVLRIPVGTRMRLVHCLLGAVAEHRQLRTVVRKQSRALIMRVEETGAESWLYLEPGAEYRRTPAGFEIVEDGEVSAAYEWVPGGSPDDIDAAHREATMEDWARAMTPEQRRVEAAHRAARG